MARTALTARVVRRPTQQGTTDEVSRAEIERLLEAIRAKSDWFHKILDEKRDLATKWAEEAGLLPPDSSATSDNASNPVLMALEELKQEAHRIHVLDHAVRFTGFCADSSREIDFGAIHADVLDALKYARGFKYALRTPKLKEDVGVFTSDDLVPPSLHLELTAALDALAEMEPKDFHPGTSGKVQDLIHPSLYPYISNVTPLIPSAHAPPHHDGVFRTEMVANSTIEYTSKYAWIPSVFQVSEDGTDVRIQSYINGLGSRERFPDLYRLIEQVFLLVLPHFEETLRFQYQDVVSRSVVRWHQRYDSRQGVRKADWEALLAQQKEEKERELAMDRAENDRILAETREAKGNLAKYTAMDDAIAASPFKGQSLKVIVKAANYHLKPGETYEGTWHMEGMPHEQIVASAIYYYDTSAGIVDEGLSLRRTRRPERDFPSTEQVNQDSFMLQFQDEDGEYIEYEEDQPWDYPSDWEDQPDGQGGHEPMWLSRLASSIALGTVPTTNFEPRATEAERKSTGRILSFPNWIQHKVGMVKNGCAVGEGDGSIAKRKILCFFLVQENSLSDNVTPACQGFNYAGLEDMDVLTTAQVPAQERACNARTLRFVLPAACQRITGKRLPVELVEIIGGEVGGVTREEAEGRRRALMWERGIRPHGVSGETYSLCEH